MRDDDRLDADTGITHCGWCGRDRNRLNKTLLECGWCGTNEQMISQCATLGKNER